MITSPYTKPNCICRPFGASIKNTVAGVYTYAAMRRVGSVLFRCSAGISAKTVLPYVWRWLTTPGLLHIDTDAVDLVDLHESRVRYSLLCIRKLGEGFSARYHPQHRQPPQPVLCPVPEPFSRPGKIHRPRIQYCQHQYATGKMAGFVPLALIKTLLPPVWTCLSAREHTCSKTW